MKFRKIKKLFLLSLLLLSVGGVAGVTGLYILDSIFPFPGPRIEDRLATSSAVIYARDGNLVSWRVDRDENRRLHVAYEDVSPWLVQATIAVEDKRFRSHPGVDPVAIARAVGQNLTAGRRVSGASTITMQTIRLLWPRPRRLDTKIIEAFRAWQLERAASKDRILEIYLNLAPYGGNVIGAEAASRHYFGKSAAHLNLAEAALLAGIPQSPSRLNPLVHPEAAKARRNFVLRRMREDGLVTPEQARRAMRQPVDLARPAFRMAAPHFAEYVAARVRHGENSVVTTLDPEAQTVAANLARPHAHALAAKGVSGPAVVVLSVADSSILAYLGNASPEGGPAVMLDAARTRRQPGSLLKPFIFAMLAGKGKIAPSTRVYDLPMTWSGYAPRNMDREWRGSLTASEALRQSRNVTAVAQLNSIGPDAFADFMREIGLEPGRADRHGLALALGAKEQTLLDLTGAYAALGRLGVWLPPRFVADSPVPAGRRALPQGAAWLALSALSPPENRRAPRLVWKTGTSWNQQDAWAVAMTPEIVVGVWCGRLGRGGSGWTAGGEDALPLALDILEAVAGGSPADWPHPRDIAFQEVCAESGERPGWGCRETIVSPMLVGNHGRGQCPIHTIRAANLAARAEKPEQPRRGAPRIVSPSAGAVYLPERGGTAAIPLLAEFDGAGEVTWFAGGRVLGTSRSGRAFAWQPKSGAHRLSAVTEGGGVGVVEISVE